MIERNDQVQQVQEEWAASEGTLQPPAEPIYSSTPYHDEDFEVAKIARLGFLEGFWGEEMQHALPG